MFHKYRVENAVQFMLEKFQFSLFHIFQLKIILGDIDLQNFKKCIHTYFVILQHQYLKGW